MHRRKVVLVNTSASFHTVYSEFSTSSVGLVFGVFRWLVIDITTSRSGFDRKTKYEKLGMYQEYYITFSVCNNLSS
jgi:hypothetical protein